MLSKTDLESLIQGCRKGDRYAQNRVYRAFYAWAHTICQRYTKDWEAAQECVQDGFFKIFTKIDKYGGDLSFEAWLKKIMVNTCIDRYRASLHELPTVELTEAGEEIIVSETRINANAEYLLYLVRSLPPAYQATFNLYAIEGYGYQEIADILGVNIGTVKSNLHKARLMLKAMLTNRNSVEAYGK